MFYSKSLCAILMIGSDTFRLVPVVGEVQKFTGLSFFAIKQVRQTKIVMGKFHLVIQGKALIKYADGIFIFFRFHIINTLITISPGIFRIDLETFIDISHAHFQAVFQPSGI